MAEIRVVEEKCIGCKKCLLSCPFGAIEMRGESPKERKAVILDKCTLCGACVETCKYGAIELIAGQQGTTDNEDCCGIWVYCEQFRGSLRPVALELLGQGRRLADELNCKLTAVLVGAQVSDHGPMLIAYGADEVLLAEDDLLAELSDMAYSRVLVEMARQYKPNIFLLGATSFGRSLAPRIAASLRTGLTADCTVLAVDKEKDLLLQTRPAFGGNLMATIITPYHRPQMATIRPRVFSPLPADEKRQGRVIQAAISKPCFTGVKILELISENGENINIGDADILVAVGRGIGNAKNIALAEKLASQLGGAVAVSRPLVDNGWYGYSHQVGQTGKTVAPRLYLACGISGAIQHLSGVAAECIIAVNNDPDAPIFSHAHYAVQGDCIEFLTTMLEMIAADKNTA